MTTALIIGASRGIGREFVRQLLANKYEVFATARDDESLARLQSEGAQAIRTDVTLPASLAALARQLNGKQLDLVVYVAGVFESFDGATELPAMSAFDATMHANVLGAMQSIPLLAPLLTPSSGRFAFITSGMGSIAEAESSMGWIYRASKAALNMAVHSASPDYPNIALVTMNPGWVKTDMGGSGAPTSVTESVAGMLRVIGTLGLSDSGSFQSYDGRKMAW
ncbi:MAG: SDR family oxidoreductase [Oxalobacteraceae bacterium]|jgi:NAD(P)-dependent dehydrogenase (short-subunit alcohol dehydrogenase family)|nr:SDR family oxidoreductase [Oxalobacteraceae bacterium]